MTPPRSLGFSGRIYAVVQPLLRLIRRSRWVIKRIFGVRIPSKVQVQFDPVTVLLAKSLPSLVEQIALSLNTAKRPIRVLEMGIGEGALVTLSLDRSNRNRSNRRDLQLDGVDCSTSRLASSIKVAEFNDADCRFWFSDLFDSVPTSPLYDLIFFNPPYVPTQTGRSLKLTERLRIDGDQMWDGGEDGTQVLRRFLVESRSFVSLGGLMVFGVQPIFVNDKMVAEAVTQSGLQIHDRFTRKGIPAVVYAVKAS